MNNLKCSIQNMLITLILVGFGSEAFAQPVITSFSPSSGPIGTVVSIIGTGLASPTHFSIGGTDAIIISNDGIALVGMVMPGAITGKISIVNDGVITNSANNFSVAQALIPIDQQGSKLTPSGYSGASWHGESVSISADGSTAIVGGSNDNNYTGAAWIYTRNGGAWTQQAILEANDNIGNSHQGFSVAISADGNTAIVGGYGDNSSTGAAWIYTRSGSTWTQQGSKLVGTGNAGNSAQGSSVALSADGNTAILGGSSDNVGKGATWIFSRSGSTWTQQGSKLVGTDGIGQSYQGKSVALSADGNTTIVGGYKDNGDIGAVWIYARSGSTWTQQGSKLVGTGYDGTPSQGISVSLSADGNTAMVGGFLDDDYIGAAWIFTRSGGAWTQQGTKLIGSDYVGTTSRQGSGVALSADGNTALVGGYGDNGAIGAAWIYHRSSNTWTQQGSKLVGTGNVGVSIQGYSVSLSADGSKIILGGPQDGVPGAAWVFPIPMLGSGTQEDPFRVSNCYQLNEVRNNLDAYYIQTGYIDLGIVEINSGIGWTPIGDLDNPFTGNYDGNGFAISNLYISSSENFAGLFGMVDGAVLSGVNLIDANVNGSWYAGALAGFVKNSTEISDCRSTGSVSGEHGLGGLIGENYESNINKSFSTASVSGNLTVGGLVGYQNGTIENSYARGAVNGSEGVAGLVGHNGGSIINSYSTGLVTASSSFKGGLAWANTTSFVENCYWDTETSGQSNSSGGTGLTTEMMQKQAFFIGKGWDFNNTWGYNVGENDGYPFLRFQGYSHVKLFDGGTGSDGDPWQISTATQLDDIRFLLDSSFILTTDLDLGGDAVDGDFYHEGAGWEPLGSNYVKFTGNFEGNNHTISNLFINRDEDNYVGLFGYVYGAEMSNISLAGIDITGKTWTGGLAGLAKGTPINNCVVDGEVNAYSSAGGLVGASIDGQIINVSSAVNASTTDNACGGIVGSTQGTVVNKIFFSGTVSGNSLIGGLIGYHNYDASLLNSYSTGTVTGTATTGGLVGWNSNSSIENCYSNGPVSGTTETGGLIGYYTGGGSSLSASYWDIETSGQEISDGGTGKSSAEMKMAATYIPNGWNFDDPWGINAAENGGYPFYRTQPFTPVEVIIDAGQTYLIAEDAANASSVGFVTGFVQNSSGSLQDWQITAGNEEGDFEINAATGELTVASGASLDYEITIQYILTLTVSDGTSTSVAEDITIDLEDVDLTTPVITASQEFAVDENSGEGTLGIVLATDSDPETVLQDWTITDGNDLGYFALDASTAELTVTEAAIFDYETTTEYVLTITVGDGTNTSASETITINVNQVNEDPVVDADLAFSLDENATEGTLVGTVTGADEDAETTLQTWTIVSGNEDSNFELDGATGDITVATGATLSYETAPQYNLMLTVSDGTNTSAEEEVIIYIYEGILYVNASATGDDNGGSWAHAYDSLYKALAVAGTAQQIWVASGTYTPTVEYDFDASGGEDSREVVFQIPDEVEVYGGFNGTETMLVDRDPEVNVTILSGDLNDDDNSGGDNTENAYHVVFFDAVSDQTVLDGFAITGGNANGSTVLNRYGGGIYNYNGAYVSSAPVVRNCIVDNNFATNYGGGIFNMYHSTDMQAQYINCTISNNSANTEGGGVANYSNNVSCSPAYTNCIFEGNSGGAIYNYSYFNSNSAPSFTNCQILNNTDGNNAGVYDYSVQSPATLSTVYTNCVFMGNSLIAINTWSRTDASYTGEFINCTFAGNRAYYGSAFYNQKDAGSSYTLSIRNSIIAGNTSFLSLDQVNNVNGTENPTYYNSIIEGSGGSSSWDTGFGIDGGSNLDLDPLFLEPVDGIDAPSANGNYRLSSESPALDAGNNTYNSTDEDLDNETRIQNTTIDMGAYEGVEMLTEDIFYVDMDATGNNDGSDWTNAFTDLENALGLAAGGDEIWVAAGTYYPTSQGGFEGSTGSDSRAVTFQLRNGVKLYGGFAGSESSVDERDIWSNETILSGDIDKNDFSGGDSLSNAYHVIYLKEPDSNMLIDGFTITRGNANGSSGYQSGGGIFIESSVENLESSPLIIHCTITSNFGYYGGGLYNEYCTLLIRISSFTDNVAGSGGGVYNDYSEAVFAEVLFSSNTATSNGGAVYNDYSKAVFTEVLFSSNTATSNGGAIYNNYDEPVFINCKIQANESNDGGGVYNKYSNPVFYNSLISGNHASNYGGGVRNEGQFGASISPEFVSATISGNNATTQGGGMYNMYASPIITNSIVWKNDAPSGQQFTSVFLYPVFSYSIVEVASGVLSNYGTDAGNNSVEDPLFVSELDPADAPSVAGDFTLGTGSAAINAGNDSEIPLDTYDLDEDGDVAELHPLDLADNLRQDQVVDIGPYEINEAPVISTLSRKDPVDEPTNVNTVIFELILSEPIVNIDLADFILSGTASGTLKSIDTISSTIYEVTVEDVSGDGLLDLDLDPGQDIKDPAGFLLSASIGSEESYTIDNTYPDPPAAVDLLTADDSGDSDSDDITYVNIPSITGTAEEGSTVVLTADGSIALGSTTTDVNGNWEIIAAEMEDGEYSITATATDTVGNESAISGALLIEIDTQSPVLSMVYTFIGNNTFGPVSFLINVEGADHQTLTLDDITLVTDNDVAGDISIDSLTTSTIVIDVANITGSGNFYLAIAADKFADVAGNLSGTFDTDEVAIEKAEASLTMDAIGTKTYGDATFTLSSTSNSNGALTYSSSDETVLSISNDQATILKAGTATITVDQAENDNYLAGQDEQVLVIAKADLQVTADEQTKIYGTINPGFTLSYLGFVNGEDETVLDTEPTVSTTADENSSVGPHDITVSGGSDNNYNFTGYNTGTLSITQAGLIVTVNDTFKIYGEANPVFRLSYEGFVNGEDESVLTTLPSASSLADETTGVGTIAITVTGGLASNYAITYQTGTLTINQAILTVTADDYTRIYGEENPVFTFTYTGFVGTDSLSVIDTPPDIASIASNISNAGTYTISLSGGADNNYNLFLVDGTLTVNKVIPVITWVNPSDITYGTDLSAAQLNATANVSGIFTYSPLSGFVMNAGANQTLSVSFVPADATNYNTVSSTQVQINVNKANPVVTWVNPSDISYGTPLSAAQLNATANLSGIYTYSPLSGTVMNAGTNQILSVDFAPTDATNYNTVSSTQVQINVNKANPVVTWVNPSDITYGTVLSDAQLNATANVSGIYTYSPLSGIEMNAGANQTLSVDFTPTDAANYNTVSNTQVQITVNKADPVVTWVNPSDITFGTALSATELNATANVDGTFIYSPAGGIVMNTGSNQTLSVDFTPTDAVNYNSVSSTQVQINVIMANPVVTWVNPSDITYGTALSATELNASANVEGTFTYTPSNGTLLNTGANQILSVNFAPTDALNYNTVSNQQVLINVNKATPVISWLNPETITYGKSLDGAQLNATANVQGTFTYTPDIGALLNAGANQTLSVDFIPTDVVNYIDVISAEVQITVNKATSVVTWNNPSEITYGNVLSSVELNAMANVEGIYTYSPDIGTLLNAGANQILSVDFSATDSANYTAISNTEVQITVNKATPVVTWSNQFAIDYGTALSVTELNATANVEGTFTYTPDIGSILNAGDNQILSVDFSPLDAVNYNLVLNTQVQITVNKVSQTITFDALATKTCGDDPFILNATATSGFPVSFTNPDSTIVSISGNVATILSHGTITITASQTGNENFHSAPDVYQMLMISEGVDVSVRQEGNTLTANVSGLSYQWVECSSGIVPIDGEISQSFTPTVNGDYAVIIIINGCGSISACFNITGVGIIENSFGQDLKVFPNPTTGKLTIEMGNSYTNVVVKITDILGRIREIKSYYNTQTLNLDLKGSKGLYFVTISNNKGEQIILKVVKE